MVKTVVTGASGFLGSSVVALLKTREDLDVVPVSRQSTIDAIQVADYAQTPGGDVLVHLAEASDRGRAALLGSAYTEQALVTLEALLAKGFQRVIYVSSAILYGDDEAHAHGPADPVRITDAYTRLKRESELAVLESSAGVVARLANVYGAGMSERNVLSTILRQIPGSGPVRVLDTTPVRDFLWIDDASAGIGALAIVERSLQGVFNLGTGIGTSVATLARTALDVAGECDRPVEATGEQSRPSTLIVDASATTDACGWFALTSVRSGLGRLLGQPAPAR